jgi:DeoR family transcriptional regulator, suf operon transcriptional repressor
MANSDSGSRVPIGTRQQIVNALRRTPLTASEIGARLGLTHNAVRVHLSALQRDGLVRQSRLRKGAGRPSVVYEVVPTAEALFSRAYVPFVAHLVQVLQERLAPGELDSVMHTVGRRLASQWSPLGGDLPSRLKAASTLLEELGALNEVEEADGEFVIRGYGCLLSAAVQGRPEVCRSIESLLAELLAVPVRECCDRSERPRCCFQIASS